MLQLEQAWAVNHLEVGGLLAHGAIYAREMSIAAVLNVPNVVGTLKTGMNVRVNGILGTVEILN